MPQPSSQQINGQHRPNPRLQKDREDSERPVPFCSTRILALLLCVIIIILLVTIIILLAHIPDRPTEEECPTGQLFVGTRCKPCSEFRRNCASCYDLDSCTLCQPGYELIDFECNECAEGYSMNSYGEC